MTDAERWASFLAAAIKRSADIAPKDAAAIADRCEDEFQLRWHKDRGYGWVRRTKEQK